MKEWIKMSFTIVHHLHTSINMDIEYLMNNSYSVNKLKEKHDGASSPSLES